MNIQTPRPSDHAPAKADPLRLASATIKAVDQIGVATAEEIEKTSDEIMRGAAEIAERLRELANAIREHTRVANEHVAGFCDKASCVFEGVRALQERLLDAEERIKAEANENVSPLPVLIRKGPGQPDELGS
jgi:uncharacterized coiled-coil DUF342 family protein